MTATTPKRPPLLAAACLYLGVLAAVQSIRAIALVSTWNAESGADKVAPQLDAIRDAGVSQASAESGYKVFLTVLAVLAAAGVVFAIYTARGDRPSRIGLTVVMVLVGLFFFLGATGGSFVDAVIGALAVAFTVRLWTGESKAWFRSLRTGEPMPVPPTAAKRPDPFAPTSSPAVEEPVHHPAEQPLQQPSYAPGPAPYWAPPCESDRLPRPVGIAVWTTFAGSLFVAVVAGLGVLMLGVLGADGYRSLARDSSVMRDLVERAGTDVDELYRGTMVLLGVSLSLSLGGLLASSLALARKRGVGVFLFVMAGVTVPVSLLFIPFGLLWTAAAIVVIVQLRKPESRRWFVKT